MSSGTEQARTTNPPEQLAAPARPLPPPRPPVARKRKKGKSGTIIIIAIVALVAIVAFFALTADSVEGTEVEVEAAQMRTIVSTVTAPGVIEPETQVVISSEVSGEIVFLGVEEGDRVAKGQVLVRINPESIVAQREQAQAQIMAARARAAQAQASLLRSQQELARLRGLHEKKLVTDQEFENAGSQVSIAEAEVDAARYAVQQAEAGLRQVQESLGKTTIVSPISGVVTRLNLKVGEKVVGAIQMTGTEIMTVADLSVIEAVVDVVETDVVDINAGDMADVEVDAFPNERFRAIVSSIANSPKSSGALGSVQDQLTNFEVRLRFLDPDPRFRPGMTATATIRTDEKKNVVAVPIQAVTTKRVEEKDETTEEEEVVRSDDKLTREERPTYIVWLVVGDSVMSREVNTGIRDDQYMEITNGLVKGDEIVVGSYKAVARDLEEGSSIRRKKGSSKESE